MLDLLAAPVPALAGRGKARQPGERAVPLTKPEVIGGTRVRQLPVLLAHTARSRKAQPWLLLDDLPWAVAYMQSEFDCSGVAHDFAGEPTSGLDWDPARSVFSFRWPSEEGKVLCRQRIVPRFRRHTHVALTEVEYGKRKVEACRSLMDEVAKLGLPTGDFEAWLGSTGL
ncbi:MAG: hypothetical protein GY772_28230 [bacterium]|nr:hypothetical protein [bacterium]